MVFDGKVLNDPVSIPGRASAFFTQEDNTFKDLLKTINLTKIISLCNIGDPGGINKQPCVYPELQETDSSLKEKKMNNKGFALETALAAIIIAVVLFLGLSAMGRGVRGQLKYFYFEEN